MAYIYLLNLYEEIERRIQKIDSEATEDKEKLFTKGRVEILKEFKLYLTNNMNDKLPRRIRKRLSENQNPG